MRGQQRWQRGVGSQRHQRCGINGAGAVKTAALAALCSQRQRRCKDSDSGSALCLATAAL
eukprot:380291-Pleurochrysis_carterae.AAC.1